ncbi:MAG TPA: polysaccharide pyruvyl transferase CsaB [Firmicutes bacterium]|jgi:polysaccharide pyruvyl transferase CsaB|nr:polysaccharide pyruvyl transferase CsaB [Bacillota bacterium]
MNGFVIFGYYGRGNLGDETNLRELVAVIRATNPEAKITVISANPVQTTHRYHVNAVAKVYFVDIAFAIWHADALIGGGGSLFQDKTSLRSLLYYSFLVLLAKLLHKRIMMYGQGIGPIRSRVGRIISCFVLSKVHLITVRDRLSIIALAELGVRQPEIFITAEPLLILKELQQPFINHYWREHQDAKRLRIGLIVQKNGFMQKKFWSQLLECISWDQNIEPYLIPTDLKDLALLADLSASLNITMLPLEEEWEELQKAIGGLDLVVSTRLHGLVAAVVQNISCLGVSVDPKIEGFCLQLGVPFLRPTSKMEWLSAGNRILSFLYQPLTEQKPWGAQVDFWRVRALENQFILKKFIT